MRDGDSGTAGEARRHPTARDHYAGLHPERVARVAVLVAARLGYERPELHAIEAGALLHDIGKARIPETILLKPARSTRTSGGSCARTP